MRRRAVLTGVLAWVLVVTVASGVTWAVIEGAGQSLLAGGDPVAETLPVPGPAASQSARSPQPSAKPSKHRRPRTTSTTPGAGVASPVPSRSPASTAAPPPRTSAPASRAVERTWEGPPGLVTVRCDGARTTLRSATPSNGYRVEVDRGTERIEVHFESASREYKVLARCFGGVPRFAIEGGAEGEHDE